MAILAHGATIAMSNMATTPTFTPISEPLDIDYDPGVAEKVDVTNHDSLAREYLGGLSGEGSLNFDVNYDQAKAIHKELRNKRTVETPTDFRLTFKDGTISNLSATVSVTFTLAVASAAQIMSVALAISDQPTFVDP